MRKDMRTKVRAKCLNEAWSALFWYKVGNEAEDEAGPDYEVGQKVWEGVWSKIGGSARNKVMEVMNEKRH